MYRTLTGVHGFKEELLSQATQSCGQKTLQSSLLKALQIPVQV